MRLAYGYATLGDIDMAMAHWQRSAEIVADEVSPAKIHKLRALILLGNKGGIPMQQVLDALGPLDPGSTDRMEIEANLAIIRGEARDWLASHSRYLTECLDVEIDEAYADKWRECGVWLDGLLLAAGEEVRARAAARNRLEWLSKFVEFWGRPKYFPRHPVILGDEDKALEAIETRLAHDRGNPYMFRLYLDDDLRFTLYHDPVLGAIRDHPRFGAVVAEVEADLAQQFGNVREMERSGELPTIEKLRAELGREGESSTDQPGELAVAF